MTIHLVMDFTTVILQDEIMDLQQEIMVSFSTTYFCYTFVFCAVLFMVALWNRADHYIFALWFFLLLHSFFPRLISAVADWMAAILLHMVCP